jgi:hypothetical protein
VLVLWLKDDWLSTRFRGTLVSLRRAAVVRVCPRE